MIAKMVQHFALCGGSERLGYILTIILIRFWNLRKSCFYNLFYLFTAFKIVVYRTI